MKKICFLSWHFQTPAIFLDYLRKMTPGSSGKWKDMEAVTAYKEADFIVVFDGFQEHDLPADKTIYVGQHPDVGDDLSPSFRTYQDKECLVAIRLDKFFNPGEWWIKHSYDELTQFDVTKNKNLICVMTYQTHNRMYEQRVEFMEEVIKREIPVDLYGRPEERFKENVTLCTKYKGALGNKMPNGTKGEHTIGKEIIADYRYTLDFDVGPTRNYISERFYDSILLWCLPLYFGSTNVGDFLPKDCFRYIDIEDVGSIEKVKEIANSNEWSKSIPAIAEARNLLLNKYQTWAYVYDIIHNVEKYQTKEVLNG